MAALYFFAVTCSHTFHFLYKTIPKTKTKQFQKQKQNNSKNKNKTIPLELFFNSYDYQ